MSLLWGRRILAGAMTLVAAAAMTACGSKTSDEGGAAGVTADVSGDTVKVGLLNSLSGTMAISEVTVRDSIMLAVEEINAAGGVLGKKIQPVGEDGASDWPTFAEKAEKLISEDRVAAVFGVLDVGQPQGGDAGVREEQGAAVLPGAVRGPGAVAQHLLHRRDDQPADRPRRWTTSRRRATKSVYLVGSDYVFPRTANKIIKAYAAANGMTVVGEEYAPLGSTEFGTIVNKVKSSGADAVFNTLNGDSNVAFFKEYKSAGLTAADDAGGVGVDRRGGGQGHRHRSTWRAS